MQQTYYKDLWQVLRESIGYSGEGDSYVWTKLAYEVLRNNLPSVSWRISELSVKGNLTKNYFMMRHFFIKSEVPEKRVVIIDGEKVEKNIVTVDGEQLERLLKENRYTFGIIRIPRTTGFVLRGEIQGTPGLDAVLDGTADQEMFWTNFLNRESVMGGFYGAVDLAPDRLKHCYKMSSGYDQYKGTVE